VGRLTFDPQALYDAVDAKRRERGMTWASLSKELHVSTTTIKNLPKHRLAIELDGVIALACWLGRTVESFAGGDGGPVPPPGSYGTTGRFLRFDTAALYVAVSEERRRRGLTWNQVSREIWPTRRTGVDQLKGMSRGGRSNVYRALAICEWLGRPIRSFQRETHS
jgi:hypothetical protein